MPKVAYSEEDRKQVRQALIAKGLELMIKQGIQHTTVEQIYKAVGISRTFFYTFFATKEDLIVEMLYLQQPKLLAYAKSLMENPALSWREGIRSFLEACCYGEKNGIAVLTVEEQQMIFRRLSKECYRTFREKQRALFGSLLECFGIKADPAKVGLFTNLSLSVMILCRAIPDTLPLFDPEAARATVEVQIEALVDCLERFKEE